MKRFQFLEYIYDRKEEWFSGNGGQLKNYLVQK